MIGNGTNKCVWRAKPPDTWVPGLETSKARNKSSVGFVGCIPLPIHETNIFTYIYHKFKPNVGKYTIFYMDTMGRELGFKTYMSCFGEINLEIVIAVCFKGKWQLQYLPITWWSKLLPTLLLQNYEENIDTLSTFCSLSGSSWSIPFSKPIVNPVTSPMTDRKSANLHEWLISRVFM